MAPPSSTSTTSSGGRLLLVCVDSSSISPDARHSAELSLAAALAAPGDELHLLHVLPARPAVSSSAPLHGGPLSTAAATEAALRARNEAALDDRRAGSSWLRASKSALVGAFGVDADRVFIHLLNPALSTSSAASVAAAITSYAHAKRADCVVIGSRGLGAAARTLGSVIGLGSVSDSVVEGVTGAAVAVARRDGGRPLSLSAPALLRVAVCVDGSKASEEALAFACRWCSGGGALSGRATLLLMSAAQAPPFPFVYEGDFAPGSAVAGAVAAERFEEDKAAAAAAAKAAVERAVSFAVDEHGVDASTVETAVLDGGGAGGAQQSPAEALLETIEAKHADVVVVGSRGLGAWRAAALALVGMGSVSRSVLHRAKVPVVVVKSHEEEEVVDE